MQKLTAEELKPFLSSYLTQGRAQETWQIDEVTMGEEQLSARVSMVRQFISNTDGQRFHLTIFSSLEFISQLMIIYAHLWAGRDSKIQEGWMVESQARTVRAIREPHGIQVDMKIDTMRKRGDNLYCAANAQITDAQGGLFEVGLKGFLA